MHYAVQTEKLGHVMQTGRAECQPGQTGTIPHCWARPWTGSTTSARSRTRARWTRPTTRTRPGTLLDERGLRGDIAHKGEKAPIQATRRWHIERTNAWHNGFNRF